MLIQTTAVLNIAVNSSPSFIDALGGASISSLYGYNFTIIAEHY